MKKIITPYIILCVIITGVSNFSFGQNTNLPLANDPTDIRYAEYCITASSVCGTAPEQFTFLMDFVREMMNSIKTMGTEGSYVGKYVNPSRFHGNTFVAPKTTLWGKLSRNISQKLQFGVATTAIFSSSVNPAGLKDMLGSVLLLSKNHVFLRDDKLVEQLESQLNDKKYELGLGGGWYEQVIPENLVIMQGIIDSYKKKGLLIAASKVNPGVSYNEIVSSLSQVLSSAKSFLYFGTIDQFNVMTKSASDKGIFIGFTMGATGAMATIQRDYNCARGPTYMCSSESKKIKEGLSEMWKGLSLSSVSTKKTFKDAVDRLGQIFTPSQKQTAEYKEREADLLRSMYGTTKVSKGTLADSLKKSWAGIKESSAEVVQDLTGLASDIETFRSFPKTIKGTVENIPSSPVPPTDTVLTTDTTKSIDSYVYDVFASQKTDLDLVSMTEVKGVTPAFTVLGKQVATIKNDILGNKEKENSLIKNLGVACELQCGRGGLCR